MVPTKCFIFCFQKTLDQSFREQKITILCGEILAKNCKNSEKVPILEKKVKFFEVCFNWSIFGI